MPVPICPMTGKVCYSKRKAKVAARSLAYRRNRRSDVHAPISTYECHSKAHHPPGAGKFHIGHTPSRKRNQRTRWKLGPLGHP